MFNEKKPTHIKRKKLIIAYRTNVHVFDQIAITNKVPKVPPAVFLITVF